MVSTSLRVSTEVSPEVSAVQLHQGSPLVSCGSEESLLLYPLVPNQADPKRVHSICTTDWYIKTRLYHIQYQTVPI
jgi:hypothetical protein